MEHKLSNTAELTHEQRLERLHRLLADLQRAVDVAEEQRRILRDLAHSAEELADGLEADDSRASLTLAKKKR
jgi:hypothetical protein